MVPLSPSGAAALLPLTVASTSVVDSLGFVHILAPVSFWKAVCSLGLTNGEI
jgi:hypothetical protein